MGTPKNILVIGYFGYSTNQLDGQTLRTRNVFNLLKSKFDEKSSIVSFDTESIHESKIKSFKLLKEIISNKNIVLLMAVNGKKYILPLLYFIKIFSNKNIIVIPIGAFLTRHLENDYIRRYMLSKMRVVLSQVTLETQILNKKWSFKNADTLNNFRINNNTPSFKLNKGLKIIYFARIDKMKGLDVMFKIAEYIENSKIKDISIDFYGQFDDDKTKMFFDKEIKKYPCAKYKGYLEPEAIYKTLDSYDLLVLPTKYLDSEGFPGSILDAYISGIPVLVSNWLHANEFVEEGVSGFIRDPYNPNEFIEVIMNLYNGKFNITKLKHNAYKRSLLYGENAAWEKIKIHLL